MIPFDPLFSDVHCQIHMNLGKKTEDQETKKQDSNKKNGVIWREEEKARYIENINAKQNFIEHLCGKIESFTENNHDLNSVVNSLGSFFIDIATKSFSDNPISKHVRKTKALRKQNKP